jgi:hypothetical protein
MDRLGEEQPRGTMFAGAVIVTVVMGAGLAALAIYQFRTRSQPTPSQRTPPPVVIKTPPEIRYVEKPVPAQVPAAAVDPPPAPPAPPPVEIEPVQSAWDGVWRPERSPLPIFELRQVGNSVMGKCAPNWSVVLSFRDGKTQGNTVAFAVADPVLRVHFRMTLLGTGMARLEGWITEEDWLVALANANKIVRTPQQALLARNILQGSAKRRGKPVNLGRFTRAMNWTNGDTGGKPDRWAPLPSPFSTAEGR